MHVDADIILYSSFQTALRFGWDCEFAMWALKLHKYLDYRNAMI